MVPSNAPNSFWSESKRIKSFYSGGHAIFSQNGSHIASLVASGIALTNVDTGITEYDVGQDEDMCAFAYHDVSGMIVGATRRGMIRMYREGSLEKSFGGNHSLPITEMSIDPTGEHLVTGSVDSEVHVFNLLGGYQTHKFVGHRGAICLVRFHSSSLHVCTADVTGVACVWDLHTREGLWLRSHVSAVPGCAFLGKRFLVTGGRDHVLCVWNTVPENRNAPLLGAARPIMEAIEGVEPLNGSSTKVLFVFATVGSSGMVKIHALDSKTFHVEQLRVSSYLGAPMSGLSCISKKKTILPDEMQEQQEVLIAYSKVECIFEFLDSQTLEPARPSLTGNDDDVTDCDFLDDNGNIVVLATNGDAVRVHTFGEAEQRSTRLLRGHESAVLSVSSSLEGGFFVTGSKDQTARVWSISTMSCLGVCIGHTDSVASVAATQSSSRLFATSGQEDNSIRVWMAPTTETSDPIPSLGHRIAHTKAVTDVALSLNDSLVATSSLDKSAKVWRLTVDRKHKRASFDLHCELKGHRRAVHSVRFSHADRVVCTGSSDTTIRIWSIDNGGACVRSLEGHAAPVTCAIFLGSGSVLGSVASDGAFKTWDLRTSACLQTNEHSSNERAWTLALAPENSTTLCTVGSGGATVIWKDCTETDFQSKFEEAKRALLEKQELEKCVLEGKFTQAALLALGLNRPHQLRLVLEQLATDDEMDTVLSSLVETREHAVALFRAVAAWNTSARTYLVAQRVLRFLLNLERKSKIVNLVGNGPFHQLVEACDAYTDRHVRRLMKLQRDAYLLEHAVSRVTMFPGVAFIDNSDESDDNNPSQKKKRVQ